MCCGKYSTAHAAWHSLTQQTGARGTGTSSCPDENDAQSPLQRPPGPNTLLVVRFCPRLPAVGFICLSCVAPVGGSLAPLVTQKTQQNALLLLGCVRLSLKEPEETLKADCGRHTTAEQMHCYRIGCCI
jgi:hypothetical protein